MAGPVPRPPRDAARLSGLRLVILSLSLVGVITAYAAIELFRFGDLTAGLQQAITQSEARRADLTALSDALQDLSGPPGADAALSGAAERLTAWRSAPAPQLAARDILLQRLASLTVAQTPVAAETRAALVADLREMTAYEAMEAQRFLTLWGEGSRELSSVLSLTLAAIVVLIATVVLRSLAYLSGRDQTEAFLRQASEEAERANAAKSEFLATISHELRTPLTGVLGYADLLSSANPRPDQRARIDRLREAGQTLSALIDDLLDLSRIEAGRIETSPAPLDLPALLERVVALVAPVAAGKGLRLTLAAEPGLPRHVTGDAKRITQILLNLLNNAVKFTDTGSVTLTVRPEGGEILFTVTDTGIGIAEADLPKLFRRFSQIDGSSSRSYGGTGLGLAISRGLVEAMGGRIDVTSSPGAGSSFRVRLPLPEAAEPPVQAPPDSAQDVRPSRILLVEDSEQNQDIVRAILQRKGHSVHIAADGIEGVEAARSGAFDLILMDMQMPRMDGIDATRAIRALPGPQGRVPILALSANVQPDQIAAMRVAGAEAHLGKPFSAAGLVAACAALLDPGPDHPKETPMPDSAHSADAFDALAELLGADWAAKRLSAVLAGLDWTAEPPADRDRLRQLAHRLVSEAGQLGFTALSDAAAAVEEAIRAGADPTAPLARLTAEASRARALGPALLARLTA